VGGVRKRRRGKSTLLEKRTARKNRGKDMECAILGEALVAGFRTCSGLVELKNSGVGKGVPSCGSHR